MMRIRIDKMIACPRFIFHLLSSPLAEEYFRGRAKRAVAQASINQRDVNEFLFSLPSYDKQVEISEAIDSIQDYLNREVRVLGHLRELRSSLAGALITGQIRVTPDETPS
jgi:type I restriction enzyme S subunit